MQTFVRGRLPARAVLMIIVVVLGLLALAAPALAAPNEPILTVAELRAKLDSAPMDGHLNTVIQGYAIEEIPLKVESIMDYSWGSLILFEAYGPVMDKIGSVSFGMSGSPIYVDDGGTDKLVGALSYGLYGTVGGMCMATPVEYMSALEADYQVKPPVAGSYPLEQAVKSDGAKVTSIRIAASRDGATNVQAVDGQAVMAPLGLIEIGGLDPRSKAYAGLAGRLHKLSGLPVQAATGSGIWTGLPAPDLQAGSAVCQLFSRGAVWYGAAGTVTYVHDGVVMAFGHSSWWVGSCDAAMTGGYVAATWPTIEGSYKMISPRDVKGTITQDRNWGIAGVIGQQPDMFPVTSHISFPATGREVSDTSEAAQWTFFNNPMYAELAADLPAQVLWDACDAWSMPGSAETTTKVVVSDETGTYTVKMDNLWSSTYDITWDPIFDAYTALYSLSDDPDGNIHARVESLDFDAKVSNEVRSARFASLALPNGLRTGDNPIEVSYYRYGSRDLQKMTGNLTIPEGTPVNGAFDLFPGAWYGGWYWDYSDYYYNYSGEAKPPANLADIVESLNTTPKNSDVILTFYPQHRGGGGDSSAPSSGTQTDGEVDPNAPIEVTFPTDLVFDGEIWAETWSMQAAVHPRRLAYNGTTRMVGVVENARSDLSVGIYKMAAGSTTETFVKTVAAPTDGRNAFFTTRIRDLKKNTTLIARVAASDSWLPGSASAKVKVAARVGLTVKVAGKTATLTAHVLPASTGGTVGFQVYKAGRWQRYGMPKVVAAGIATIRMPVTSGAHKVRAKFLGSEMNTPATSPAVTFTVN